MNEILTIYQLNDISEINGLKEAIEELNSINKVKMEEEEIPAAVDFFGKAIKFILSEPIQSIVTIVALGQAVQYIIDITKKAGKKISVNKGLAKILALSKLKEIDPVVNEIEELQNPIVWGPMLIESLGGNLEKCIFNVDYDSGIGEVGYLIAIALKKGSDRVRTIWQIIGVDGMLLASWATQTLIERVPEFLRPY